MSAKQCRVLDCTSPGRVKRGYCPRHYTQILKYGEVQPDLSIGDRFWMRVDKSAGPGACWLWTKERNNHGYGYFYVAELKTRKLAHRYALLLAGADIEGKVVLHRCDTPSCVNPAHLAIGTQTDNMRDMVQKGRINPIGIHVERAKTCRWCDTGFVGPGRQHYCTPDCCRTARRERRLQREAGGLKPAERAKLDQGPRRPKRTVRAA